LGAIIRSCDGGSHGRCSQGRGPDAVAVATADICAAIDAATIDAATDAHATYSHSTDAHATNAGATDSPSESASRDIGRQARDAEDGGCSKRSDTTVRHLIYSFKRDNAAIRPSSSDV
jgi:hypothetical protein